MGVRKMGVPALSAGEDINPPVDSIKQALRMRRNLPQLGMIKFLFQMFTPRCYWFGIFLLWCRILQTSVLVFMPPQLQLVFASCVSLIYVAVLRESSPFLTVEDNLIALLAAWAVFFWVVSLMLIK